ncbi:hypothetical protein C8A01DRAFT_36669 [Parachaetomium inaequale]|uniref:Uncharacterized protein n=1 Tax=Parachaetomium inaequale TaxID=2588326 RepID=A0AAN6PEE5_9PEZI|nr:hypothetical protein C8A01DRAFT_36669 [Parachaetomium inaequale]
MVKRAKAKAKAVKVGGRTYHPEFPPSEQNDVEKITKRFKNKTPDQAADVAITEEELRNFAKVYRRLYQVARTNQDRLKAWAERHANEIQGWDVGDFFKSKEHDERDGSVPVDAGPPKEAFDELERLREADKEAANPKPRGRQLRRRSGAQDDEGNEGHSENGADSERHRKGDDSKGQSTAAAQKKHTPSSAAGPMLRSRFTLGDKKTVDPAEELEAVIRSIQDVSSDLTHLSNAADERDAYKKSLSDLAQQLDTGLEHAQQAKEAIVERLQGRSPLFDDSLGFSGSVKKRGRQGLEEASEEEQIRARRAHAVASLPTVKAKQMAAVQPPSLPQGHGPASPYYHSPYQGHGPNAYGAAAFQPTQQFQWSPPTAATADHSHAGRHHQNPGFDTPSRAPSQHHSMDASHWSHTPGRTPDQYRTTVATPGGTPSAHPGFAAPSHPRHSLTALHEPSARNQPAAGYASHPSNYDDQGFPSSPLGLQTHGSAYYRNSNSERREDLAAPAAAPPTQNSKPASYTSHRPSNYDDQGFPSSPLAHQGNQTHGSYHHTPNSERDLAAPAAVPTQNPDNPNKGYPNGYEAVHAERRKRERDAERKEAEEDGNGQPGSEN